MKKEQCNKCNLYFSLKAGNYARHIAVCTGPKRDKNICLHCGIELKTLDTDHGNHVKWCEDNPKRNERNFKPIGNAQMMTPAAMAKKSESIKKAYERGAYNNRPQRLEGQFKHSIESKDKIRQAALASPHRRLRRKMVEYKGIMLDSSWEYALAVRLDELNIEWSRPTAVKWVDENNITRNYFPDFYLPKYNMYLDPKNPYACRSQRKKIECLKTQLTNLVILYTLEECKEFVI